MTDEMKVVAVAAGAPEWGGRPLPFVRETLEPPEPVAPVESPDERAAQTRLEELGRVIAEMESRLDPARTDLRFRVDRELGRVIVSVVDAQDGTVLRQLPSEEALRVTRLMEQSRQKWQSVIELQA